MEKPFVKSLTAVAVGAGAIAICLFGYHINNQRQHQQRITYAESAITNQKDTLTSLSKEVDKLYSTKEKIFLNPEITEETITSLSNKLSSVKLDLSQYLGHILVETAKTFSLFLNLQTPVELSNESNYGFDYDYKILQCS